MKEIKETLKNLTGKKYIYLTKRGNESIKIALQKGKKKHNTVHIQDQGGWMTYKQFAEKLKLEIVEIETDFGLVSSNFKDSILLINTLPGYAYLQDTSDIKSKNCFIINDVTGSIGTDQAKWGDIVIGSFGKDKPINLGRGGFIATNNSLEMTEEEFTTEETNQLKEKLQNLQQRLDYFTDLNEQIKRDLKYQHIVHFAIPGINVIIRYYNEKEKQEVLDYCEKKNYPFTECPRYIRINDDAICIEVKRL